MATVGLEKQPAVVPVVVVDPSLPPLDVTRPPPPPTNAIFDVVLNTYRSFQDRRDALGLRNPGTIDQIAKEVQRDVFLTNQMFSGLRAELNKSFSLNPIFQVSHAFAMGSQMLSPYTFLALYGTDNILLQGQVDSDASFNARFNIRLHPRFNFKSSVQIQPSSGMNPGGAQVSLEQDYVGNDFTAQLKSINPSLLEGGLTGMFVGSYLQSVTPRLSLGLEGVWQKPGGGMGPEAALSYAARYKGDDWIASAQLLTQGGLQGSYWRRLTDKVETGVDVNLQFAGLSGANAMMGGGRKEGTATLGAKYEFSRSIFRAQVDSQGKIGCLLDKVIAPPVRVTFAGEMDHAKNQAKLGLAVSIEASGEELMEQQDTVKPATPPF
ncbi:translocase of outer mitochondrial membrane [Friedmanniomyces endolithicus]|uniref:Translocase of outer mitochondrial membrane n=1 Tax=Friedmanniomyces endolithicus TaxID=329885 RepID=A0AAN6FRK9_9PEZI|nr:translocase of outer mitochondrial membrane [Friedmanniomyces endolithicus]KAK0292731.1 translocase of outer mitochondrial membrane [Friedmanniomyces endolithicus]KAK0323243.1 translocase of outer mitochondrial membrane [Friedmanniomyces endolithicus]KAK1007528.1 translocase of outer mitochondrial membrane [Friedmanniomyces endolithicus]KAK1068488.1 translocase of outer mitochondrial membrane [Friedmanniomyces endolithicus]